MGCGTPDAGQKARKVSKRKYDGDAICDRPCLAATPAPAFAGSRPPRRSRRQPVTEAKISAKLDADYADLDADQGRQGDRGGDRTRCVKSAEAKIGHQEGARRGLRKLDTNGDGQISRAEFEKASCRRSRNPTAAVHGRFDANKDGAITAATSSARRRSPIPAMDADKDGSVTAAEQAGQGGGDGAAATTSRSRPNARSSQARRPSRATEAAPPRDERTQAD